jgi:hypothetical protein
MQELSKSGLFPLMALTLAYLSTVNNYYTLSIADVLKKSMWQFLLGLPRLTNE